MSTAFMPLEPLEAIARTKWARTDGGDFSDNIFASLVGVSNRAIRRWRDAGNRVPWETADIAAITLGIHPILIWPDEWAKLDRGVVDGTDAKSLRAVDQAITQIGRVLDTVGSLPPKPVEQSPTLDEQFTEGLLAIGQVLTG